MNYDRAVKHPTVLLIDDEQGLVEEISAELRGLGYPVLHGSDGLSLIKTLREEGDTTPVLVISALSLVGDRICGAEGDLVTPLARAELATRAEALARSDREARTTKLHVGNIEMDLIEQTVRRGEKIVNLLPTQFRLLEYFLHRPGQVVTRAMLLEEVWRGRVGPQTNVIDVHIGNLRRRIDVRGKPSLIKNIRGAGFKLNVDACYF